MPFGINSNITSINIQRHLSISQGALNTSVNRLSSGQRINSAIDDAAGLAIADRLDAQIRGNNQARRNVNDYVSALQIADGALVQMTNNTQRIRELAVQAANETNTLSDRAVLQKEVDQLMQSSFQIGSESNLNGLSLLDGSLTGASFQIGSNAQDVLHFNIGSAVTKASTGLVLLPVQFYQKVETGTSVTGALAAGELLINGTSIGATSAGVLATGHSAGSAWAIANAINARSIPTLESVTASTSVQTGSLNVPLAGRTIGAGQLTINGVDIGGATGGNANAFGASLAAAITGTGVGVTASYAVSGSSVTLTLTAADGADIAIGGDSSVLGTGTIKGLLTITTLLAQGGAANLTVAGSNPSKAGLTAGTRAADPSGAPVPTLVPVSSGGEPDVSLSSTAGANAAIQYADDKITKLAGIRANIGASQNQLDSVMANLVNGAVNSSAARSRIQDADYATESMTMTRNLILQNAGVAILGQSNASASNVLNLLKPSAY